MQDQPMLNVRQLAAAAGIRIPDARLPAIAAALPMVKAIAEALARTDYGEAEPAARFRAPGKAP
ncbi:MAG: hypothetical protein Q7T33_05805 [Dehalococcoidia bacterium]|nr:hypothetical protein [Dehalococcoidia bacterium]